MLTHHFLTRPRARLATAAFAAAVLSTAALAGGPTQPDPPVPAEAHAGSDMPLLLASADGVPARADRAPVPAVDTVAAAAVVEPDCRCGALYARGLERRVEGHVEHWEAMRQAGGAAAPIAVAAPVAAPPGATAAPAVLHLGDEGRVHLASLLVDGMLGFPLHDFRLAE